MMVIKEDWRAEMTPTLKPSIIFAPSFNICTKQAVKACKNRDQFANNNQFQPHNDPVCEQFDICTKGTRENFIPILTRTCAFRVFL